MTRSELFLNPPTVVAFLLMTGVSGLGGGAGGPWAIVSIALFGAVITAITIDTGAHLMVVFGCLYLLFAGSLVLDAAEAEGAVAWAGLGVVLLVYAEAVRLAFAHRRHGEIDTEVHLGAAIGVAIVTVGSLVTAAVVAGIAEGRANASWLLVPLTLVLVIVGVVGLTVASGRSPGQFDTRRWRPGERLAAPPRAASDDPSLETSTPPPPTR